MHHAKRLLKAHGAMRPGSPYCPSLLRVFCLVLVQRHQYNSNTRSLTKGLHEVACLTCSPLQMQTSPCTTRFGSTTKLVAKRMVEYRISTMRSESPGAWACNFLPGFCMTSTLSLAVHWLQYWQTRLKMVVASQEAVHRRDRFLVCDANMLEPPLGFVRPYIHASPASLFHRVSVQLGQSSHIAEKMLTTLTISISVISFCAFHAPAGTAITYILKQACGAGIV